MQRLKSSTAAKIIAVLLTLAAGITALACAFATACLYDWGAYDGEPSFYDASILTSAQVYRDADAIFYELRDSDAVYYELNDGSGSGATDAEINALISEKWGETRTNLVFELFNAANPGEIIYRNYTAADTRCTVERAYTVSYNGYSDVSQGEFGADYGYVDDGANGAVTYILRCSLRSPLSADDKYMRAQYLFEWALSCRYELITAAAVSLALALALLVFCVSAAGHTRGANGITGGFFTKWPLDILLAAAVLCISFFVSIPMWGGGFGLKAADYLIYFFALLAAGFVALLTIMNIAIRVKLGGWWKNSITYKVLSWLWRLLKSALATLKEAAVAIPLAWRTALVAAASIILIQSLCTVFTAYGGGFAFLVLELFSLAAVAALCRAAADFKKLSAAAERIAAGDFEGRVDGAKMLPAMKKLSESLNNIGEGMNAAVEQRTKSERLKAELITNVSHDIKTPLTSIINYTDLLKAEKLPEKAAGYVEVLDRQSARLKKLTNDLVEASKASTGNIAVKLEPTDLGELVAQSVGEYAERLEASGITPIVNAPEGGARALADGQLTWRIFDNLLSNACKYSQSGTRLYIDLALAGELASATFKSVSKAELNVDADELMERFVRGDSARSGEGSGLGLNIAKSLAELQHGALHLSIDGDLFKAAIELPAGPAQAEEDAPGEESAADK